jgi:hypothetical protein
MIQQGHLFVNFAAVGRVMYLLDTGALRLSPTQISVLTVHAMNVVRETGEVCMSHEVVSRRTGFKVSAIKEAIKVLEEKRLLRHVGHSFLGIKRYRLTLPEVVGTIAIPTAASAAPASAPAPVAEPTPITAPAAPTLGTTQPFEALAFVQELVTPIAGIDPSRVRAVVRYYLVDGRDKFWRGKITSEAALQKHLPKMEEQYRESHPRASSKSSVIQTYHEDFDPLPLSLKQHGSGQ